jgi:hypothetical protein
MDAVVVAGAAENARGVWLSVRLTPPSVGTLCRGGSCEVVWEACNADKDLVATADSCEVLILGNAAGQS